MFPASLRPTSYGGPDRGYPKILWHVDPLLGNDNEINNYTIAVNKQQPVNSNRGKLFSVRSVPRCYKQE
jgi:hypothetical protein